MPPLSEELDSLPWEDIDTDIDIDIDIAPVLGGFIVVVCAMHIVHHSHHRIILPLTFASRRMSSLHLPVK